MPTHPALDTVGRGPRLAVGGSLAWGAFVLLLVGALGVGEPSGVLADAGVPAWIALAHLLGR